MTYADTHTDTKTYAQLPLTAEGVQKFMTKLRGDAVLRREVISLIEREGSLAMIKKYFTPNGKQQKAIAASAAIMNAALTGALTTNGDITLSQSVMESPGLHVGVTTWPDGTSTVTVDCEL